MNYGIDKVEFVSKKTVDWYNDKLKALEKTKKILSSIKVRKISNFPEKESFLDSKAFAKGYKSKIIVSKISNSTFKILSEYQVNFGTIWLIEIFRDIECENEENAKKITISVINKMYLNYQNATHHLYDRNFPETHTKKKIYSTTEDEYNDKLYPYYYKQSKKKSISDLTLYLGSNDFIHATYARKSKSTSAPVIHQEFRLMGRNISRLAGIKKGNSHYLGSLKNLQSFHAPSVYEKIASKHIKYGEINKLKLAKFLSGCSRKKKLTSTERLELDLLQAHLKNAYRLNITADFVKYFKENGLKTHLFVKPIIPESLYGTAFR